MNALRDLEVFNLHLQTAHRMMKNHQLREEQKIDVLVIGAGISGLSAA